MGGILTIKATKPPVMEHHDAATEILSSWDEDLECSESDLSSEGELIDEHEDCSSGNDSDDGGSDNEDVHTMNSDAVQDTVDIPRLYLLGEDLIPSEVQAIRDGLPRHSTTKSSLINCTLQHDEVVRDPDHPMSALCDDLHKARRMYMKCTSDACATSKSARPCPAMYRITSCEVTFKAHMIQLGMHLGTGIQDPRKPKVNRNMLCVGVCLM